MRTTNSPLTKKSHLIVLITALSLMIAAGGYFFYKNEESSIRQQKYNELKAIADLKVSQIEHWVHERYAGAKVVTNSDFFTAGVQNWLKETNNEKLKSSISERLKIVQSEYNYENIFLCTPNGSVQLSVADTKSKEIGTTTKPKIIEAVEKREIVLTDFYLSQNENKIHYDIIAPIITNEGNAIAALVFRIDPNLFLYPLIQEWPTPSPSSETAILRVENENVLFLNELRHRKNTALKLKIPLTRTDVPAVQAALGRTGLFEGIDYRGVEVLSDIRIIPATNWIMLSKVDKSEIYADLYLSAGVISGFTILLIVICAVGFILVYNQRQKTIYKELYKKEKELWQQQERFKVTMDSVGEGIITTDVNGKIQYLNTRAEELTGWKLREAKGRELSDIYYVKNEETGQIENNILEKIFKHGIVKELANHTILITKNRNEIPVMDTGAPIFNIDGSVNGIVITFHDETEKRSQQKLIKESEFRFRSTLDHMLEGCQIIGYDWRYQYLNDAAATHNKRPKEELLGKRYMDMWPGIEETKIFSIIKKCLEERVSHQLENEFVFPDGTKSWFDLSIQPVPEGVFILSIDITERKQTEEEIEWNAKRIQASLQLNQMMNATLNEITDYALEQAVQLTKSTIGYLAFLNEDESILTMHSWSKSAMAECAIIEKPIIYPVAATGLWGEAVRQRQPVITNDYAADNPLKKGYPPGHVAVKRHFNIPVFDGSRIVLVAGVGNKNDEYNQNDVYQLTLLMESMWQLIERKHAEETIKKSEEKYRSIFESFQDVYYQTDLEGKITILSPSIKARAGYDPSELIGRNVADFYVDPANRNTFMTQLMKQGSVLDYELNLLCKDGSIINVTASSRIIYGADGKPKAVEGTLHDITERKQMEEELRYSDQRARLAMEASEVGIWEWDLISNKVRWDDQMFRLYGISPTEDGFIEYSDWSGAVLPEDLPQQEKILQETVNQHGRSHREFRIRRRSDGDVRFLQAVETVRINSEGYPEWVVGTNLDVTERKLTEDKIRKSEEQFRLISENVADLIAVLDLEGRRVYNSPMYKNILGDPNELRGTDSFQEIHPDDREKIKAIFKETIRTGVGQRAEYRFINKDGKISHIESRGSVIRNEKGNVSQVVVISRDITERKLAEEALRISQTQFQALFESSPDGIIVVNASGEIVTINQQITSFFGYTKEELAGISVESLIPDRFKNHHTLRHNYTSDPQVRSMGKSLQLFARRKDGTEFPVEIALSPLQTDNELKVIATVRDITEKKKLEQQFMRMQRMESIGTLAGGIAHDLNNVLAPIMLALEILRKKHTDADSQRMLETMGTSAKRGSDIVKQVLAFGRGVEGEHSLLQPRHVINEIVKIAQETFQKNIQIRNDVPKDLWLINADPTQMHQVLLNTFVNARDAMPSGGTLTISAENIRLDENYARMQIEAKAGNYVLISVADTGTGIPHEILERIFEPFFTTKEIGKGTGLGLSTVRSIIKNHGGFIDVYSEKNKGTTFKFYLPAEIKYQAIEKDEEKPELPLGNGELILVVDDEASIREITKETLEASGYRVLTGNDGTEAIAIYADNDQNIDVVITDMMMPFMDGATTIRALKRMNPAVKIIAVSGLQQNGDFVHQESVMFLHKPYTAEKLLKAIDEILHRK